eukprot:5529953-Pyramimonas_sp.AAC.1
MALTTHLCAMRPAPPANGATRHRAARRRLGSQGPRRPGPKRAGPQEAERKSIQLKSRGVSYPLPAADANG